MNMKRFFKAFCVALALIASTGSAWAQAGLDIGTILAGVSNPNNWYYVNLTAKNSTTSRGTGQVRLATISMDSTRIADRFMGVDFDEMSQTISEQYGAELDIRTLLWPNGNPQLPWAEQMTQLGFSIVYMPGVEADIMGMTLSTYAYFAGWAKADDGSYFAGWSYKDGGTDLGLGGAEGDWDKDDWTEQQWYDYCVANEMYDGDYWDPDKNASVKNIYKNDKLTDNFLYLKILPDNKSGYEAGEMGTILGKTNRTLYATFLPVKVVDYTQRMGEVEAIAGATGSSVIEFKVSGKNIDNADFNTPVISGDGWSVGAWGYDAVRGVVSVEAVYTASVGIEAGNEIKTTLTLSSKAGSSITAPVSVRVVAADRNEAALKIGEVEQGGSWADMLAAANAAIGESVVLTLNKDVTVDATQEIGRTMTLNLNGYKLQSSSVVPLKINDGVVTLAYSKYMGSIEGSTTAVEVAAGELVLEGGEMKGIVDVKTGAKLTVNGADVNGLLNNSGTTIIKSGRVEVASGNAIQSSGDLTIEGGEIYGQTGIFVKAGSALLKKGYINGQTAAVVSAGNTTIEKLAELTSTSGTALVIDGGTTTINCGKFDAPTLLGETGGTLNFVSGYFKSLASVGGMELPAGMKLLNVTAGPEYRDGYIYFVGNEEARLAAGVPVCTIGTTGYAKLEDALAYANNNKDEELTIVLQADYTLPAGYYTLPAKAMLLIPFKDGQETGYELITRIAKNSVTHVDYIEPFEYRRLTMSNGTHLDVFGTVEISGRQFASDEAYAAVPYAGYGHIYMNEGASITMQGGSLMRAWGYMTGKGEMDVRRGAIVREQFQMGDWKGGTTSMGMLTGDNASKHVFPLTQYWMQNIESPVKYHAGSVLSTATAVSAVLLDLPIVATANDIKIVGIQDEDDAMFLMSTAADEENTWVRKWYDVENDIQTYEVYSAAHIGSMVLDLGNIGGQDLQMHSGWFNLPITNNMKIHLLYGYMDFTQNTELLPGAEVEIDKEATVAIVNTDGIVSGSLYIYDADDWDKYAYDGNGSTMTKAVKYSPSWFAKTGKGTPNVRNLNNVKDAQINVHGTFDAYDGDVFTSDGGANIFSTNEDAGTFKFSKDALTKDYWENVFQVKGRSNYEAKSFNPAWLKNADGQEPAYATTAGTPAGKSYCYMNDKWTLMDVAKDPNFMVDNYGDYYAKPDAYISVVVTSETNYGTESEPNWIFSGNDDHTFKGKYETDRSFILVYNEGSIGQWWEVEKVGDNLYHCLHPNNDTYYFWNGSDWEEKKFTITWKDWDGDDITTYYVPYGTMAEYRSTNPEREATVDYTYDFVGWQPALGTVTGDVTYTATYEAKQRMYTIVFQTEGGAEIERQFLTRDEFPVCENEPTKVGHILRWEPALAAVTGDAVYTATWLEEKPATWNIRFVNYNGAELQSGDVVAGTMPEEPATPVKPATTEYTYTFVGWKPALEAATRDLTYTAQFEEVAKTYTITFYDEDGTTLISEGQYAYGETPVCTPAPTRDGFELSWDPQIQTVIDNQDYQAVWTPVWITNFGEYRRTVTNAYGTLCLPQSGTITGATLFTITSRESNNTKLYCDAPADETHVEAGVPYIFYANASEIVVTYESLVKEIAKTVNGLVGTNTGETFTVTSETDVCMLSGGKIVHASTESWVGENRAYIRMNQVEIESNPAPVPGRRRIILGEKDAQITTGTENTFIESEPVRKIMIDGQLYILSEGKMFNIMGQVVK